MGKSVVLKLVAIIVAVVTVVTGAGIGIHMATRPTPEKTIERFEDAYNDFMVEDMVECFEPRVQKLYSGVSGLLGKFIGFDVADIIDLICCAMPFFTGYDSAGTVSGMPKIDIEVNSVEEDGRYARAHVTITSDDGYGNYETSEGYMTLIFDEDDNEWYLRADNLF